MGDPSSVNIAAQQASQLAGQLSSSADVETVAATATSLPDSLADLARAVQISGSVLEAGDDGSLSLRTAAGIVTLSVDAPPSGEESSGTLQTLTDLFKSFMGSARTLEIQLSPSADGQTAQAVLLVPKAEDSAALSNAPLTPPIASLKSESTPSAAGKTYAVAVLPQGIEDALFPSGPAAQGEVKKQAASASPLPNPLKAVVEKAVENVANKVTLLAAKVIAQNEKQLTETAKAPQPEIKAETSALPSSTAAAQAKAPILEEGQEAQLKVVKFLGPKADWPADKEPGLLRMTVPGKSPTGQTILRADTGQSFFVHDETDWPVGSKILARLELVEPAEQKPLPLPPDRNMESMRQWVDAVRQLDPQLAARFLDSRLPTPAHHFAGTVMFLLSAVQGGGMDQWLGPSTLAKLGWADKTKLTDKLVQDIDNASGEASDPRVGEWKSWPIPLHYGASFEMLRLYVHEDTGRSSKQEAGRVVDPKTRFIITMNMSHLGTMQVDGLSKARQLDLIVRSERTLPQGLPDELRRTYIETLETLGLAGTIQFQYGRQGWVRIDDDALKPSGFVT